jgi:hypothetical protein
MLPPKSVMTLSTPSFLATRRVSLSAERSRQSTLERMCQVLRFTRLALILWYSELVTVTSTLPGCGRLMRLSVPILIRT